MENLGAGPRRKLIRQRSLSVAPVAPPSVCITAAEPDRLSDLTENSLIGSSLNNKRGAGRLKRLSVASLFTSPSSPGTAPLTPTTSISSLFSAVTSGRGFNFHIPLAMRRASWSVSFPDLHE